MKSFSYSLLPPILPALVLVARLLFSANVNSSNMTVGLYLKLHAFGPGICILGGRSRWFLERLRLVLKSQLRCISKMLGLCPAACIFAKLVLHSCPKWNPFLLTPLPEVLEGAPTTGAGMLTFLCCKWKIQLDALVPRNLYQKGWGASVSFLCSVGGASFLSRLVCYKPCSFHSYQVNCLMACRLIHGFTTAFLFSHLATSVLTLLSWCYLDVKLTVYMWAIP